MPAILNYQIDELIHQSDRTLVYRGRQIDSGQPVAIKLMRNEHPSFKELVQFRNQYAIALNLNIAGIIKPYTLERYQNRYALIMEDMGGISLATKTEIFSLSQFFEIALQLAETLYQLHQNRIIHKDIKPANILVHPETGRVKLIDFSISTLLPKETQTLQTPNILEGTLSYISPEQTGRTNRGIDYRSDFYALGVTFYQLLTGRLPFESDDPMELVHCHIAKTPPPCTDVAGNVPPLLSEIVMKLMAKNAEDRYQSALGLKYDLEKCLAQWQETGKIETFELGQQDRRDRFLIPEKLYGREKEVNILLDTFENVSRGKSQLFLIAGYSGVGKTAVVHEVHKPIVAQRGYFIKGKFDQFQRNIPFSAFVQAFRDLMGQLLGESDRQLQQWKDKILLVLKDNGRVIIEVIPELEKIIGTQPPVPELSGNAAQNRFNLLFERFVGIFATQEHPLVLFLDDLQWADSASLNLLKILMRDSKSQYLLAIGAYRDNEVFPAHPLILTLEDLKKTQAILTEVSLQPLSRTDLNRWVADTLKCDQQSAQPLTDLLFQKTQGNPFFTNQFLKGLHEDGLIEFNFAAGCWQCDLTAVRRLALTDDVVEFMSGRLQKLPAETQESLKFAACIGNEFNLATLAIVREKSPEETAKGLWVALKEGLILPQNETYKFYQETNAELPISSVPFPQYKFLHDRVQQAAYSLIPDENKQMAHYRIGQRLRHNISPATREEKIFELVNQLNYGTALITEQNERDELAELNLIACRKARSATTYQAGREYAKIGLSLLGETAWTRQYELTLELHQLAAEFALLCSDFAEMEQWVAIASDRAHTLLDRVNLCRFRIQANFAQNQLTTAVAIALELLQELGVTFPETITPQDVQNALSEILQLIGDRDIEDLIHLPAMKDGEKIAIVQIINSITPVTYFTGSPVHPLLIALAVKKSIQFGNTPASAFAYVGYGFIACNPMQNVDVGVKFSNLALQIVSQPDAKAVKPGVTSLAGALIAYRKSPAYQSLSLLKEGYTTALEVGDPNMAGHNAHNYCLTAFWCGQPLVDLERETRAYNQGLLQFQQLTTANYCRVYWQGLLNLLEMAENPTVLSGKAFQITEFLPRFHAVRDLFGLYIVAAYQLMLCYLFEDIEKAKIHALEVKRHFVAGLGTIVEPAFYFYDSLVALASIAPELEPPSDLWEIVAENQIKLQQEWAHYAPVNFQHKVDLVEAEKCRVLGQKLEAMELYDKAIAGAKANGYIQEEALANELAAKFYLHWGKQQFAALYLQQAYYCYAQWGAKAKTNHLEQNYPKLLSPILQGEKLNLNPSIAIASLSQGTVVSSTTGTGEMFDFVSLMKASRTLTAEIDLDRAIANLMQVAVENAGAETAALMLLHESTLILEAKITNGICENRKPLPVEESGAVPLSVINIVKRTLKPLVLDNICQNPTHAGDSYIQKYQPCSILCTPLVDRNQLRGILYLENNQCNGAFTRDRAAILNLLCAQAAIALENARLYRQAQQMTDNLQQAFQDLQQTQLQLVQNEKMATLGNLVAGVAHEINNPLGFIGGNVHILQENLADLSAILEGYRTEYPEPSPELAEEIEELDLDFLLEDIPKTLASMQEGMSRIRNISTSLRTFSRLDADRKTEFNLHEGLDSTLLILKYRLKANDLRPAIEIVKNYGDLREIKCYAGQINQVFMNLLANAIDALDESNQGKSFDAIEKEPNCITITTELSADRKNIMLTIADNGPGMPAEVKTRIFEQGFTTKEVGKGTGLGLAIAKQIIVEKHQGAIACHSEIGQGTTFIMSLPF